MDSDIKRHMIGNTTKQHMESDPKRKRIDTSRTMTKQMGLMTRMNGHAIRKRKKDEDQADA